jgi:hypothetical protein
MISLRVELLNKGVGTGEQQCGVAAVPPANEVRRAAVGATYLEDLAIAVGFALVMTLDDDSVPWFRVHRCSNRLVVARRVTPQLASIA